MKYNEFRKAVKALKDNGRVTKDTNVTAEVWCKYCERWVQSDVNQINYLVTFNDITIEGEWNGDDR